MTRASRLQGASSGDLDVGTSRVQRSSVWEEPSPRPRRPGRRGLGTEWPSGTPAAPAGCRRSTPPSPPNGEGWKPAERGAGEDAARPRPAALWSLRCSTPRAVPAPGRPPWPHTPRRTSPPLKAATITHQLCDPKLYSRPSPCLDLSPKARGPTPHRSAPDPPQAFGRREATASTGRPGQSNTGCLPAWTLVSGMSQKPRLLFC